jgi:hypothetical protein
MPASTPLTFIEGIKFISGGQVDWLIWISRAASEIASLLFCIPVDLLNSIA